MPYQNRPDQGSGPRAVHSTPTRLCKEVPIYKIYKLQITRYGPTGTLIVATCNNRGGPFKSESFCVFPAPYPGKSFGAVRFDGSSPQVSPMDIKLDFILDEAVGQARIDIAHHIANHYADKSALPPNGQAILQEVDSSWLVHLWVRKSAGFLSEVCDRTTCEALRELILPIMALPTIARAHTHRSDSTDVAARRESAPLTGRSATNKWSLLPALKKGRLFNGR